MQLIIYMYIQPAVLQGTLQPLQ